MMENATNLTAQSDGMLIYYLVKLKTLLSEPWVEAVSLLILIVVTMWGVGVKLANKRSDFYNRFQQIYDDLLKPGKVKLEYGVRQGLHYTQQNHQEWSGFIEEVNKQIKRKWWKYIARGLYKKTEKKFEDFEESSKSFSLVTISLFQNVIEKNDCGFLIWDGNGDPPSEDYIEKEQIPKVFENIIGGIGIETYESESGGYAFKQPNKIGKAKSENKMKKLGELIQLTIDNNEEIRKLLSKRKNEKIAAENLLKEYNNKLVKIIHDLRFCRW